MSYQSVTEFRRYAWPSGSYSAIPDSVIQEELDIAASELDAALRPYHTLPMVSGSNGYDPALTGAERNIAAYRLLVYRGFKPTDSQQETLVRRYEETRGGVTIPIADSFLGRLAAGQYMLASTADATPSVRERRSKMYGTAASSYTLTDSDGRPVFG